MPTLNLVEAMHTQKVDEGMRTMMNMPMAGVLIREIPGAEAKIREAVETYARAENEASSSAAMLRAREILVNLRKENLPSALKRASDADIVRLWQALGALAEHLAQTNVALCRQFSESGIQNMNDLDGEGRSLFMQSLRATEVAFLSGRLANFEHELFPLENIADAFVAMGFTEEDLQIIADSDKRTDVEVCSVTNKMYSGALTLPESKVVSFMRRFVVDE
jgi:hypothetical protein